MKTLYTVRVILPDNTVRIFNDVEASSADEAMKSAASDAWQSSIPEVGTRAEIVTPLDQAGQFKEW